LIVGAELAEAQRVVELSCIQLSDSLRLCELCNKRCGEQCDGRAGLYGGSFGRLSDWA
jgi:hypothetical protein